MSRNLLVFVLALQIPNSVLADVKSLPSNALRSAFLGAEQCGPRALSSAQINAELKEHFAVVLNQLKAQTESSLDEAVQRVASFEQREWTAKERESVRAELAQRRQNQIETLWHYAQRGEFPRNEGQSKNAVPIFVDKRGTHCAVGYLMHRSGADTAVASIVRGNNFVCVPDVSQGPLVDWIIQSGLTLGEAALIQPAYEPPTFQATLADFSKPGASVTGHGLTISEFSIRQLSLRSEPPFCSGPSGVWECGLVFMDAQGIDLPDPLSAGLALGEGEYFGQAGGVWDNNLDEWMYLGGNGMPLAEPNQGDDSIMFRIDYRVEAAQAITEFGLTSSGHFNYNFYADDSPDGAVRIQSYLRGLDGTLLASANIESGVDFKFFFDDSEIVPMNAEEFWVTTYAMGFGSARFSSVFHEFRSVPEPYGLASFVGIGFVLLFMRRKK